MRLAIEIDGLSYDDNAPEARDARRDALLSGQGVAVLRIAASEVLRDADEVADGVRRLAAEKILAR